MKKVMILVGLIILAACGSDNNPQESKVNETNSGESQSSTAFAKFQNIDIKVNDEVAHIIGEAHSTNDEFYYKVEQGEKMIKAEEKVQVDGEWGEFEIHVAITNEMRETEEVVILTMYTKDEEGTIINPNYIPLDLDMEIAEQE